jgi:DNA-3-methyladenine glycosylase II
MEDPGCIGTSATGVPKQGNLAHKIAEYRRPACSVAPLAHPSGLLSIIDRPTFPCQQILYPKLMRHLRYHPSMARTLATLRSPRYDAALACQQLEAADPKLGKLIQRAGPFAMKVASAQSPFEALVESIIYQQLHGKAAATIHRRLLDGFEPLCGVGIHPSAQHIIDCPNEQLRAAGLSHNKSLAVRDLAAKTIDGTVPTLAQIRRMSDEAIVEHLTQVRGVGKWTVEMLLIFRLGRPDIFPTSDYGVRKGFALTFGKLKPADKVTPDDLPKPDVMEARAKRWTPWRSVASWYLWRACDLASGKLHQTS